MGGSLAAAKEVGVDVLSELGGIFRFTEEQRSALQAFLGRKNVSTPHLTGFGNLKNVAHSGHNWNLM